MVNHIMGIDHAIVGVRDLAHARTTYERLGFHVTPQGRHVGWGTANYCLMFPADYVELLGIVDPEQFTNNLDRFLETREGLLSLALRSANPEGTHEAWRSAGLEPTMSPKPEATSSRRQRFSSSSSRRRRSISSKARAFEMAEAA